MEDPQALVAWLYRIARDRAYGRLRKARRLEVPLDEALVIEPAAENEEEFSAEDALQDVWLDVFRGLPRLEDPQALVAWLYRIARDRAYGRLRKARPLELLLDDALVVEPAVEKEEEFSAEDAAQIHAALDDLPAEQREVLVLRFLEEMSYEQIARVVGCQLGTVRSRIHYAKRALRSVLERS